MHILYIHQHFAVPSGSTGTRSYEFARRWVRAGHRVTVITGHYDIGGLQYSPSHQMIDGIEVRIVGAKYSNKQSFIRRVLIFAGFVLFSFWAGLRVKNIDVIYATSTPLTIGIPTMWLKFFKRIPFVFEVRDQWPEIPVELGVIKNRLLIKILLYLEKRIYKSASAIVALSPGMADGIRLVIGTDKQITVAPNCCDVDVFKLDVDGSIIREKHGWGGKFVFIHAGAMGKVNSLDFVINAAQKVKDNDEVLFVLVGEGRQKTTLQQKVNRLCLTNFQILPAVPKKQLPEYLAAADVGLVIIGNYPIVEHNSANKFFDSLSAGKPILLNYSGWQREIIEDNNAGLGCTLCDIEEFVEKVSYLNSNRDTLKEMGENSRRIAIERFDRNKLAAKVLSVIESVLI